MVKQTNEMNRWILGDKRKLVNYYGKVTDSWIQPENKGWMLDEFGLCPSCGGKVLARELKTFGGYCGSCSGY